MGFRRGWRHPIDLRAGDAVDFWRVEAVEPGHLVRQRAEMKVPGRAWLQFEAVPLEVSRTRLVQAAYFAPKGLFSLVYWHLLYPIHGFIFSRLIRALAQGAAARVGSGAP